MSKYIACRPGTSPQSNQSTLPGSFHSLVADCRSFTTSTCPDWSSTNPPIPTLVVANGGTLLGPSRSHLIIMTVLPSAWWYTNPWFAAQVCRCAVCAVKDNHAADLLCARHSCSDSASRDVNYVHHITSYASSRGAGTRQTYRSVAKIGCDGDSHALEGHGARWQGGQEAPCLVVQIGLRLTHGSLAGLVPAPCGPAGGVLNFVQPEP